MTNHLPLSDFTRNQYVVLVLVGFILTVCMDLPIILDPSKPGELDPREGNIFYQVLIYAHYVIEALAVCSAWVSYRSGTLVFCSKGLA